MYLYRCHWCLFVISVMPLRYVFLHVLNKNTLIFYLSLPLSSPLSLLMLLCSCCWRCCCWVDPSASAAGARGTGQHRAGLPVLFTKAVLTASGSGIEVAIGDEVDQEAVAGPEEAMMAHRATASVVREVQELVREEKWPLFTALSLVLCCFGIVVAIAQGSLLRGEADGSRIPSSPSPSSVGLHLPRFHLASRREGLGEGGATLSE